MKDLDLDQQIEISKDELIVYLDDKSFYRGYYPLYKSYIGSISSIKDRAQLMCYLKGLEKKLIKKYGLDLLSKKSYSEKLIKLTLQQKYFSQEAIEYVISFLKYYDFLNDRRLFKQKIKCLEDKGYGQYYIIKKLERQYFFNKDEYGDLLDNFSNREKVIHMMIKRKKSNNFSERKKLYLFLLRKGHSHEFARDVLNHIFQNS